MPPPPATELRLSDHATRQVWYQLLLSGAFVIMFVPFLVTLIIAVLEPQPSNNRAFGILGSAFVGVLVAMAGRYWLLFAIHVRVAKLQDSAVYITRFFAPAVLMSCNESAPSRAVAVPSLNAPGYQRGTLFMAGTSSFYLPHAFPEANRLAARVGKQHGAQA